MRKKIGALLTTLGLTFSVLIGLTVAAPQSQAASCGSSHAVCMFANINSGGAVLGLSTMMCGSISNLTSEGFNDVTSSIDNWVQYSQGFWTDANFSGVRFDVGPYVYVSNIGSSLNDKISSVIWIG